MKGKNSSTEYWVGVDWGDTSHAIAIVDGDRRKKQCFEVPHSVAGMEALSEKLAAFHPIRGIAIESSRNLVITHLLDAGYVLYLVNPKLSASWRKNDNVAGCKSDKRDGLVLARELSMRWERLEAVRPEDPKVRELAMLCHDEQRLIGERTRHVQRLISTLKAYFPGALSFFDDWTSPAAWSWLKRYPTPEKFAKASEKQLHKFLREHRIGISPAWQERVSNRASALGWAVDPAVRATSELRVTTEIEQLESIDKQLAVYRKRIGELFKDQQDCPLFESLPGAGKKLAPRLFSMFGANRARYDTIDAIRLLSGAAPVMKQSGNSNRVKMRHSCRKAWRNTLHLFADLSKKYCPWAKAFYEYRKARGDRHAEALRKLADKWLKIIYRMWREQQPYNEEIYMESLYKRKSPLLGYLPVDKSVENVAKKA